MRACHTLGNLRLILHSLVLGLAVLMPSIANAQDVEEPAKPAVKQRRSLVTQLVPVIAESGCVVFGVILPIVGFGVLLLMIAKKLTLRNACFVIGGILAAGPIWAMIGTPLSMVFAFRALGESDKAPVASDLAASFSLAYATFCVGLAICPVGVLTIAFAAFRIKASRGMELPRDTKDY